MAGLGGQYSRLLETTERADARTAPAAGHQRRRGLGWRAAAASNTAAHLSASGALVIAWWHLAVRLRQQNSRSRRPRGGRRRSPSNIMAGDHGDFDPGVASSCVWRILRRW